MSTNLTEFKKQAAETAVQEISSGMVIGLGTGSTSKFAILKIAELIKQGRLKNIVGIPSSNETAKEAIELGIPITGFDKHTKIDITIDGADEVDKDLNLIKGGGGALLHEKILAQATVKEIIIVDETKLSTHLGEKWSVPVEVVPFALHVEKEYLEGMGATVKLRMSENSKPFTTDEGNYILDSNFGVIKQPSVLAQKLEARAGIAGHGLFIGLTNKVISAGKSGISILNK